MVILHWFSCQPLEANFGFIAFSFQLARNPNKFVVTTSTLNVNQFWIVSWSSAFWSKCISISAWVWGINSGCHKPFELFISSLAIPHNRGITRHLFGVLYSWVQPSAINLFTLRVLFLCCSCLLFIPLISAVCHFSKH